ncbi:MAG TPA: hypothetical protein VKR32_19395 [Puia sp.]|nr:hypothetical protein [Puia sp.]
MKAEYPGEYIHMIIAEIPTLKDGKTILFISVDNYSRYAFSDAVLSPLSFEKLCGHLDKMMDKLGADHPGVIPTFILAFGEELQFRLKAYYTERARFIFNVPEANSIAKPVADDLFKSISKRFKN